MRDVDLDVAHGERRAILGPNGAGKTTLFNVISGDVDATPGTIEFDGSDTTGLPPPYRTKLGMSRTYQKSRLFLGLSVEDNLYLGVLGVRTRPHAPAASARATSEMRERARRSPPRSASATRSARSSARSRTASSASSRSAWRRPAIPS